MKTMFARWLDSDVGYSFRSSPLAMVAAAIALVCLVSAGFAHWIAPHNPFDLTTLELSDARLPPAWEADGRAKYLLGTDDQGRDVLARLQAEIARILNTQEVRTRLAGEGAEVVASTPEQFSAFLKTETAKFERIIREARIRATD